ncbi:MAG TPA: hypothetical protein VIE40_05195 [Dehalococcoidia bacterium]|jgi:hypothetical protein
MRFPDITVALRGVRGPRRRYAAGLGVCALSFAMLASGACIGRGNGTSTGPSQNTGTVAAAARAADTPFAGVCSSGVTPAVAATKRGNEEVTVVGPVVAAHYDANQTDAPTYLELGAPNPDPKSLSIVVLGGDRSNFPTPPETLYKGKTICVVGVVQTYMQRHAIIVGSPEAISVVPVSGSPTP